MLDFYIYFALFETSFYYIRMELACRLFWVSNKFIHMKSLKVKQNFKFIIYIFVSFICVTTAAELNFESQSIQANNNCNDTKNNHG